MCSAMLIVLMLRCPAGHEKLVRVFDLERPDAAPQQFAAAPGKVRCLVWTADDALLLSSDIDSPNITCAPAARPVLVPVNMRDVACSRPAWLPLWGHAADAQLRSNCVGSCGDMLT